MRIEPDGPVGFGKHGSFSGFTSGGGIARLARQMALEALEKGGRLRLRLTGRPLRWSTLKYLAAAAKTGDEDACRIFEIVGEKLGKGIALLVDILNPEVVVIGSIFGRCETLLRPRMEEVLARECIPFSLKACRVVPAQTGEQIGDLSSVMAAVYGAGLSLSLWAALLRKTGLTLGRDEKAPHILLRREKRMI